MAELLSKDALEIKSLIHHLEQEKLINLNLTQQLHLAQDRIQEFNRTNEENQILYQRTVEYGKEIQQIKENSAKTIERATLLSGQYADTIYKLVEDKEQLLDNIEQLKNERKEDLKIFEKSSNENDERLQQVEEEKRSVATTNTELSALIEQLKQSLNSTKLENENLTNEFQREKSDLSKKMHDQMDSYSELKATLDQTEKENKIINEELTNTKVGMEQIKFNFNQLNTAYKVRFVATRQLFDTGSRSNVASFRNRLAIRKN
jgi:myosin heavy subunit